MAVSPLLPCLKQGLVFTATHELSGALLSFAVVFGITGMFYHGLLYMDPQDPDASSHICVVSFLPTMPTTQSHSSEFVLETLHESRVYVRWLHFLIIYSRETEAAYTSRN